MNAVGVACNVAVAVTDPPGVGLLVGLDTGMGTATGGVPGSTLRASTVAMPAIHPALASTMSTPTSAYNALRRPESSTHQPEITATIPQL